MRSSTINDELWHKMLEQVAKTFTEVTLSRGFTYFKQQRVEDLRLTENHMIHARVTGSEDYAVTLNLDNLSSYSCTCPAPPPCKHLAAVMMELADRYGYPSSHIMNAKHHLERAEVRSSSLVWLEQLPDVDVSEWHTFLNQYTAHIKQSYDPGIYLNLLRDQLQAMRKASNPLSDIDQKFFELHQELFMVRKLKDLSAQSSVAYFTSHVLTRAYDNIHAWLSQASEHFNFTLSPERLKQTLAYLRVQMAEEKDKDYLHFRIYAALWQQEIAPQPDAGQWVTHELSDINSQSTGDAKSIGCSMVKAYLLISQSRNEEAWTALETGGALKDAPTSLLIVFLQQLAKAGNWRDLLGWLIKSAPTFNSRLNNDMNSYMNYWKMTAAHLPEAEEHWWKVLKDMLPLSSHLIEEALYEQRKWKAWIEMQIHQGHGPFYHRVSVLQPIEKEAPELLLPYYHQAIAHHVSLKNRQDYKLTVKLLKRLQKVYKKMKAVERWDLFFHDFVERHSRLRALQEEIKKGKLME
ncbi:SWIM zinc finger domain-containing protein [Paenibacillus allorhizosphaerae]|uniref:SWIM-type domain-containing protein n=1 Tax=Paenibacillus allorhizosphaerae TaxID=2849866 RepID=A0ABM8VJD5_9BACL|nr:SWIM zinc finger family protein [Paenibacillus allorhizosphaerae]CAG7644789.1 hypothetical protein PAECIP111802_03346 [Paenibacillus allorhizosphaerae]